MKRSICLLLTGCLCLSLLPYTGEKKVYGASAVTANIAGGEMHTMAIKNDGTLWSWGDDQRGRLGNGAEGAQSSPFKIMDNVISVSSGDYFAAAIKKDGTLWTWGHNGWGQLGDGTKADKNSPIKVMDNVASVSVGNGHILALKKDGTLWAWGYNACGQVGDNTKENKSIPVKIMDNVTFIAAGTDYSAAIKGDGSLWTWGRNDFGYLGNGTKERKYEPVKVLNNVKSVSTGQNRTMAIKNDGTLWGCGFNLGGTLGDGTKKNQFEFVKIASGIKDAALGLDHIAVIKNDNSLYMLGYNGWGQFGKGKQDQRTQKMIKVADNVSEVTAERWHTAMIKTDGSLWASGYNKYFQLGNGTKEDQLSFVKIMDGCNVLTTNNNQNQSQTANTKQPEFTTGYYRVKNHNTPVYSSSGNIFSYLYKDEILHITSFKTIKGKQYGYMAMWQEDDYSISSLYANFVEMDKLEKTTKPVRGETLKERLSGTMSMLKSRGFKHSLFSEYKEPFHAANDKLKLVIVKDSDKKNAYEIVLRDMMAGLDYEKSGETYRGTSTYDEAIDLITALDPIFVTIGIKYTHENHQEMLKRFAPDINDIMVLEEIWTYTEDPILQEVCENLLSEKIVVLQDVCEKTIGEQKDAPSEEALKSVAKDKSLDILEQIMKNPALKGILKKMNVAKTAGEVTNIVTGYGDVKRLSLEVKACNEIRSTLSQSFYQQIKGIDQESMTRAYLDWKYAQIATTEAYNRLPTIIGNNAYWKEYNKQGEFFQKANEARNISIREYGMSNLHG